jgi:hypothetical protein
MTTGGGSCILYQIHLETNCHLLVACWPKIKRQGGVLLCRKYPNICSLIAAGNYRSVQNLCHVEDSGLSVLTVSSGVTDWWCFERSAAFISKDWVLDECQKWENHVPCCWSRAGMVIVICYCLYEGEILFLVLELQNLFDIQRKVT